MDFGSGIDLLILFVAVLAMPAMSARAGIRLARAAPSSLVPRYWATILRGWAAAAALVGLWLWSARPLSALGLDYPIGMRGQLGFLVDALALAFFAAQQMRLPRLSQDDVDKLVERIGALKVTPRTAGELAVFLLLSVTAGVWEELLYRGFLIGYLAPRAGVVAALLLSSAIFGLGHIYQGWRGVRNTAAVGLAFAVFYALSHSLWWLMLIHALVDMNGGLAAFRITKRIRGTVKVN
jgi:membrane protease YdiL (CAAX protease family)